MHQLAWICIFIIACLIKKELKRPKFEGLSRKENLFTVLTKESLLGSSTSLLLNPDWKIPNYRIVFFSITTWEKFNFSREVGLKHSFSAQELQARKILWNTTCLPWPTFPHVLLSQRIDRFYVLQNVCHGFTGLMNGEKFSRDPGSPR